MYHMLGNDQALGTDANRSSRMTALPTEKEGVAKPQPLQRLALVPRDERFQGIPVRIVSVDGKEMMPAVDIARALKINRGSVTRSLEDILLKKETRKCRVATSKGAQEMVCITSFGAVGLLYKLNAKNTEDEQVKEKILKFQEWATGLVQNEMQMQTKIVKDHGEGWSSVAIEHLNFAKGLMQHNPSLDPAMCMAIGIKQAEKATGMDLSAYKKLIPPSAASDQEEYITATQIGREIGEFRRAEGVNRYLEMNGYLFRDTGNNLLLTEKGAKYGKLFAGAFDSGHCGYYVKWKRSIIHDAKIRENNPRKVRD